MAQKNGSKDLSKQIKNIKPAQWAVILAFLLAGYFVYQDYAERQAEREFCEGMKLTLAKQKNVAPEAFAQLVRTCARHWGEVE